MRDLARRGARSCGGLFCAAAALALAGQAAAQDAAGGIEEIVVTGSRIARSDATNPSPITVVDADALRLSGSAGLDEVLRRLPVAAGAMTGPATNTGGRGTTTVNLRGLGAGRTLVLVDGRRTVATDNLGTTVAVDLNTIPTAMVERIEVLRDGASAVYGSDAVGGVVNVILKKDFDGIAADARMGVSGESDGAQRDANVLFGLQGERAGVVLGLSYVDRDGVLQEARRFAACQKGELGSAAAGWRIVCQGSGNVPEGTSNSVPGSVNQIFTGNGQFRPYRDPDDSYNFAPFGYVSTPQERHSVSGRAHYDLAPDVTAFVQAMFTHRDSQQQLAPGPLMNVALPIANPFIPEGFRTLALQASPTRTTINLNRRLGETGPRVYDQDAESYNLVGGLEGKLDLGGNAWRWEGYYQFGRSTVDETITNQVRFDRLNEALNVTRNAAGQLACAGTPAAGCVPINLFGPNTASPEAVAFVTYLDQSRRVVEQQQAAVNLSGDVAELPAGGLGMALGAEWRRDFGYDQPDPITATGQTSGVNRGATRGDYAAVEAYAEASVPLLRDVPGAHFAGVSAAVRWSDYDNISGSFTSYKLGGEWAPVEDLRLRGVWSRAFRAPNIRELYAGPADAVPVASDPCSNYAINPDPNVRANCAAEGVPAAYRQPGPQIRTRQGGNAGLTEERADTWTLGGVLTPRFVEGLTVTADYYHVEIDDVIGAVPTQIKLRDCYASAGRSNPYCADITRQADFSPVVTALNANIAKLETSGVDLALTLDADLPEGWGGLSWNLQATRLLNFKQTNFPGAAPDQYAGYIGGTNIGSYARWKGSFRTGWSLGGLMVAHTLRYIGDARNFAFKTPGASATNGVPETWYNDLVASYEVDGLTLTAGVNNLLDRDPPYYRNATEANTDGATYDMLGRYFYVGVGVKF